MKKRKLITLLVFAVLLVEAALAYAAPSGNTDVNIYVGGSDVEPSWGPPTDEPLPCTNQRAKAWFGCT